MPQRFSSPRSQRLIPYLAWLSTLGLALAGCSTPSQPATDNDGAVSQAVRTSSTSVGLDDYWYQGKAEVSSYTLQQARYGAVHPGEAVLVFVSEDFLTDKQVKNETYRSEASTKVLKANMMRKFPTGIYDYSVMTSVFSPVNTQAFPHALKVTMSAQDWCGQTFVQVNRRGEAYQLRQFSYFEREGDQDLRIDEVAWLEEELWTRLRMNPAGLPVGKCQVLPSLMTLRLLHLPNKPLAATGELTDYDGDDFSGEYLRQYQLRYDDLGRSLRIVFEGDSPYRIVGWVETDPSGLETIARKQAELFTPYWSKHDPQDSTLRKQLGLTLP